MREMIRDHNKIIARLLTLTEETQFYAMGPNPYKVNDETKKAIQSLTISRYCEPHIDK